MEKVHGQEIPVDGEDIDMDAGGAAAVAKLHELDEMRRRLKEMEEEAAALREMQAKVAKEMQGQFAGEKHFFTPHLPGHPLRLTRCQRQARRDGAAVSTTLTSRCLRLIVNWVRIQLHHYTRIYLDLHSCPVCGRESCICTRSGLEGHCMCW